MQDAVKSLVDSANALVVKANKAANLDRRRLEIEYQICFLEKVIDAVLLGRIYVLWWELGLKDNLISVLLPWQMRM